MTGPLDPGRRRFLATTATVGALAGAGPIVAAEPAFRRDGFELIVSDGRVTRLRRANDSVVTDYLEPGRSLGDVALSLRAADGSWRAIDAVAAPRVDRLGRGRWRREGVARLDGEDALRVTTELALVEGDLRWSVSLHNLLPRPLGVGDLAWPLPMNSRFTDTAPMTSFVLKHSFVSGAGSFLYWMRSNSVGPFLLLVPEPGTALEYWDHREDAPFRAFSHSAAARAAIAAHGGTWRLPASSLTLGPNGGGDAQADRALRFAWAKDQAGVRDELARRGLLDVEVLPGMTVPVDWDVFIAFRSDRPVTAIAAEHPGDTAKGQLHIWRPYDYLLSYMAQMGGGGIMDHGLARRQGADPYLRLGFQSFLSSWALVNSGTADTDYGYWFPGQANDGAAGGGFETAAYGRTWLDQPHHRGSWYYSCEIDLGFCGALRAARTLLMDDPIFGRVCLGGTLNVVEGRIGVVPEDGVRRRFHARLSDRTLDLLLDSDRFAVGQPILLDEAGLHFMIESSDPTDHIIGIRLGGLKSGTCELQRADGRLLLINLDADQVLVRVPVGCRADQRLFTLRDGRSER